MKLTRRTFFILHLLLLTCSLFPIPCSLLHAAVPLRWTVETSRAVPATFEAYQGETLAFEAALQSYGKPLEAPLNYSLYWQTNGMGSTYWEVPCTGGAGVPPAQSNAPCTGGAGVPPAQSNVLHATWSPTYDVGARVYNCFIGQPGTIYHAAFQLRLRPSPGAVPNTLPLPTPVIDFDRVTVLHPPWPSIETVPPIVSNTVTKSYVESLGITGGIDTNAVIDIANAAISTNATVTAKADRAELAGYLPLSGGTVTGGVDVAQMLSAGMVRTPWMYVEGGGFTVKESEFVDDGVGLSIFAGNGTTDYGFLVSRLIGGSWLFDRFTLPVGIGGGTLAVRSDISATNQAFSNAVVSVTLPIGTNELAVLRDIGELPVGEGAAGLGAIVLALASAVAWLKRNKFDTTSVSAANETFRAAVEACFDNAETTRYPREEA